MLAVGGTRGVGFGTALNLARADAHVTIIGRGKDGGMDAVSKIKVASPGADVDFVHGDIGKYD